MAGPQKGGETKPRPLTKAELRERVIATRREIEHGSTTWWDRYWQASDFLDQLANGSLDLGLSTHPAAGEGVPRRAPFKPHGKCRQ